GEVVEPCRPRRRRRSAAALPGIQADVVVVAARREERGLVAVALGHVEAEHVTVEGERAVDVRDLQVNVADVDARVHEQTLALPARPAAATARVDAARRSREPAVTLEALAVAEPSSDPADVGLLLRHDEGDPVAAAAGA